MAFEIMEPFDGWKIKCRVCGKLIDTNDRYIKRGNTYEHLGSQGPECSPIRHEKNNE